MLRSDMFMPTVAEATEGMPPFCRAWRACLGQVAVPLRDRSA